METTAQKQWDHYDMLMRCWLAGRSNPAHPYYGSKKPNKPDCPRPSDEGTHGRCGAPCEADGCTTTSPVTLDEEMKMPLIHTTPDFRRRYQKKVGKS